MKIKVCGLGNSQNITDLESLELDMLGFIFYDQSSRFVHPKSQLTKQIRLCRIPTVGVFVNENINHLMAVAEDLRLTYVQLHGDESPEYVSKVKSKSAVIKAFQVDEDFDFNICKNYAADLFLFDTRGANYGGNGVKFNWSLLDNYNEETPFLLSGGIHFEDLSAIQRFSHPMLYGIDINSGFELVPGLKNTELIKVFKDELEREKLYS